MWRVGYVFEGVDTREKGQCRLQAVLADGQIVSGGEDGDVVIWKKAERGKETVVERVIDGHRSLVRDLVATSNGFAWCDWDRSTFLWEEGGSEPLRLEFTCHRLCIVGEESILVDFDDDAIRCTIFCF